MLCTLDTTWYYLAVVNANRMYTLYVLVAGACYSGGYLGVVCTYSYLLLLGAPTKCESSDVKRTGPKHLKLFVRIKKSYDRIAITNGFTMLICARVGTLDLFKVRMPTTHCVL